MVAAAEVAYLRPGEVVVCVGDSVTAAGVYDGFLQAMLDRMYPGVAPLYAAFRGVERFAEILADQRPVTAIGRPTAGAAATPPFWLTGHRGTGQEPTGFVQLGERDAGILWRIGY